jgi:putative ABC transport system permease protein
VAGGGSNRRKHGFARRERAVATQLLESAKPVSGNSARNTLTVSITLGHQNYATPERQMAFFQQLQRPYFQYDPRVNSLAMSESVPPNNGVHVFYSSIGIVGRPPSGGRTGGLVTTRMVSPSYFHTLGIPVIQGEGFRGEELNSSEQFVVLSKQLAERLFPRENAVGKRIQFDSFDSNGI